MMLTSFYLIIIVSALSIEAWENLKEHEDFRAGKAPFFELPCMRVGGTCAKMNACPPGTKVAQRGLCPEQQKYGMECCRPLKGSTECRTKLGLESIFFEIPCMSLGGQCAYECPPKSRVIRKGLCPEQQIYGVECCTSYKKILSSTTNLRAPFFELPCMVKRGTCAREFACPPGTKVMQRDLCPQQQRLGMECCRPYSMDKHCLARNGYCLLNKYSCPPQELVMNDTIDCLPEEICCITQV
ncbi:hypothetical protein PYW08_014379 [Mythimna loreyi]|uniref:Uncharacterized protein n=1 Tax=Mythimna loreyi TaxID=667449 RepID=A0ACC2RA07_9NEOP|nr:hypothetical protein PYW08_014379 [Mythimna loreyi]